MFWQSLRSGIVRICVLRASSRAWRERVGAKRPGIMTFREIIDREDQNTDSIWLYREGMFMKAYERSAFFAHTLIHEFKLSKRYIKTVNMDVISLGFPEQTIPKWLNGYVYEWVQDGLLRCHMRKAFDEVEFHNWKEVVSVNVGDRFTPHTAVIEKSPLYKVTYDLMTQVFEFNKNISKNVSNPIGLRLKELSYKLCYSVRMLYDVPDRDAHIDIALEYCSEIKFVLQVLKDLKEISVNTFALASERVVSVSKQLSALRGKVMAKVHEGD